LTFRQKGERFGREPRAPGRERVVGSDKANPTEKSPDHCSAAPVAAAAAAATAATAAAAEQPLDDPRRGLGQAGRGAACVGWPCHGAGQFQRDHVLGAVPIGLGEPSPLACSAAPRPLCLLLPDTSSVVFRSLSAPVQVTHEGCPPCLAPLTAASVPLGRRAVLHRVAKYMQELGAEVLRVLFRNASLFRWFVAGDDHDSAGGLEDDTSLDQRRPQQLVSEMAVAPEEDGGDRHRQHRRRTSAARPPAEAEAPGGAGAVQGFGGAGEMTNSKRTAH